MSTCVLAAEATGVCISSWKPVSRSLLSLRCSPFHGLYTPGFIPVPVQTLSRWLLFICTLPFRALPKFHSLFHLVPFYAKSYYILTSAELFPAEAPYGTIDIL